MKKKLLTIALAVLCPFFAASAQEIKPLTIGDSIPESLWNMPLQVVNHPLGKNTITLNDYRGKLIIVDFWATWCTACIAAMPITHRIQDKYKESVSFLAVTQEKPEKARSFLASNHLTRALHITSVVNDTILNKYFPHRLIPHYVWIDRAGVCVGQTSAEELTEEKILSAIEDRKVTLKTKADIDGDRPLFINDQVSINDSSFYSVFLKGRYTGLPTGNRFRLKDSILRGRAVTNSELLPVYEAAAAGLFGRMGLTYSRKRLVLDLKDTARVKVSLSRNKSRAKSLYNYDLILPVNKSDSLYNYMLSDLNRYSGFYGRMEKRKVRCLVFISNGKTPPGRSHASAGKPLQSLIDALNLSDSVPFPVLDESGYGGKIDISLSEPVDLETVRRRAGTFGLSLVTAERLADMFVLSERPGSNPAH
ncbi:thiol-disulfide isomerase/thioredoxin [Arcticibacter tournemirensis]|uniref:TlpA family protein disulfide reductase n=1 Tax=Arcticibacter tournemirensis TaxID=699437 RepID=A0A5M9H3Z1_9SPHI|nr:TlpA disulfide reductase family protein [Arcticibacter tournemirensis]KAA8480097.1 TlpA family protein disulfide reductase [Arcticibacter tournemirensis]TQM50701.1 thiol-disulfide isomerase/thioredoxin [Arcticibacter tournemirensis]